MKHFIDSVAVYSICLFDLAATFNLCNSVSLLWKHHQTLHQEGREQSFDTSRAAVGSGSSLYSFCLGGKSIEDFASASSSVQLFD